MSQIELSYNHLQEVYSENFKQCFIAKKRQKICLACCTPEWDHLAPSILSHLFSESFHCRVWFQTMPNDHRMDPRLFITSN